MGAPAPEKMGGALCGSSNQPAEEPVSKGGKAPAAAPASQKKQIFIDEILNDSTQRVWVDKLPECFLKKIQRPYTEEEIAAAKKTCNVDAPPASGRGPKLIFQLGAAGTGKSTRMADCYETMGLTPETVVVADGDIV